VIGGAGPSHGIDLGPAVVQLLVPQRPPFLFVDRLVAIRWEPLPTLDAARYVSASEPCLAGHFPELPVWPGALTLEGLAQTAACLAAIVDLVESFGQDTTLRELDNVSRGSRLQAGHDPTRAAAFRERVRSAPLSHLMVVGGAQVRLVQPVFPGCRLDYRVRLKRRVQESSFFEVEAEVEQRPVAEGTLTCSRVPAR
jgi:3-hydroxymyristoyl/3-hydroxydecanoyl-(acyl carrier protein) dehydratase